MKEYNSLQKFRYDSMEDAETTLCEELPHFFIRQSADAITAGTNSMVEKLGVQPPKDLIAFWENVGAGQFYAEPPDAYAGRYHLLGPDEMLGVYLPDADQYGIYNTIRADARSFLSEHGILAFCEFDEYSALYMAVDPDENGEYPIFEGPSIKIAESLSDFVNKLMDEPDYFLNDEEEDKFY